MGEVRLLHLSDFHFYRRSDKRDLVSLLRTNFLSLLKNSPFDDKINRFATHNPQLADSVAEFVYREYAAFDAIIVTGDLAATGLGAHLTPAANYITDRCTNKWWTASELPGLNSWGLPIFVLPGNHDRYCDESGTAGGREFEKYFAGHWSDDSRVKTFPLEMPDYEQLAIVAADFTLRENRDAGDFSPLLRYGRGKVYQDTITELVSETRRQHQRGCTAVMWATHFPVRPPSGTWLDNWSLALLEEDRLITAAKACGVRHLLAGHIHRKERYRVPGADLEIFCAASSLATPAANEIHVMTIKVTNGSISDLDLQDHVYDQERLEFV
jgi:3',5'-cyclic AMP phosphodiesterase CpdA